MSIFFYMSISAISAHYNIVKKRYIEKPTELMRSITIARPKYIDQISKQTRRQALSVSTTHVAVSAPNLTLKAQNSP